MWTVPEFVYNWLRDYKNFNEANYKILFKNMSTIPNEIVLWLEENKLNKDVLKNALENFNNITVNDEVYVKCKMNISGKRNEVCLDFGAGTKMWINRADIKLLGEKDKEEVREEEIPAEIRNLLNKKNLSLLEIFESDKKWFSNKDNQERFVKLWILENPFC